MSHLWLAFGTKYQNFHSTCKSVHIVQRLIRFETCLIVMLILFSSKVRLFCIYLPQEAKHFYYMQCTPSLEQY